MFSKPFSEKILPTRSPSINFLFRKCLFAPYKFWNFKSGNETRIVERVLQEKLCYRFDHLNLTGCLDAS